MNSESDRSFASAISLTSGEIGKPYLGDPKHVDAVVRDFVIRILNAEAASEDEALSAGKAVQMRSIELGRHFLGENATPMPDWNREGGGLGNWIRARLADSVQGMADMNDSEVIANAFAVLAHATFEVMERFAVDGDHDDAAISYNALIDDWRNMLLGLPNEDDFAVAGFQF